MRHVWILVMFGLLISSWSPASFAQSMLMEAKSKLNNTVTPKPDWKMEEFNNRLMRATFHIVGKTKPVVCGLTNIWTGAGFVLAHPYKLGIQESKYRLLMITAAHVLEGIDGEIAYLRFRQKHGETWNIVDIPLHIRNKGTPLFARHETADVVAIDLLANVDDIYKPLIKSGTGVVFSSMLADDDILEDIELHAGDDLSCLGFPDSREGPSGFPILRGGKVASYPILPTKVCREILFDFEVFPGNSGGPVYMSTHSRSNSKGIHLGPTETIVGLVSAQLQTGQPLKVGVVIPSSFIIDLLDKVPPTE